MHASTDPSSEDQASETGRLKTSRKTKKKTPRVTTFQDRRKFFKEVYGAIRVGCTGKVEVFLSSYRHTSTKGLFRPKQKKKHLPHPKRGKKYLDIDDLRAMMGFASW